MVWIDDSFYPSARPALAVARSVTGPRGEVGVVRGGEHDGL